MALMDRVAVRPYDDAAEVGPGLRLVRFTAGGIGVEHRCKEVGDGDHLVCAPELAGHTITGEWPSITVDPSVLCPDCGLHGFVRTGAWSAA